MSNWQYNLIIATIWIATYKPNAWHLLLGGLFITFALLELWDKR